MDVKSMFSRELNSITSTDYVETLKHDEQKIIQDLKKKADKAFKKGEFEKAYNIYNQALQFNQSNYDLLSCLTGAALNLGLIDEVFAKTDLLIQLDSSRAQGYYLKGIAYDLVFKYDLAIDFFLTALEYEKENINIVVKNLIKTVVKFIKKDNNAQLEDPIELHDLTDNLLKLIEICDNLLKKNSNNEMAIKILKFVQKTEPENYNVKTELLLVLGKFFKHQRDFDKAIITYEECCHLATVNDDLKVKIKSIVSISSCFLELSNLHKVIYYYHKLIDIEEMLDEKENNRTLSMSSISNPEMINLELRIAIRQNLFIAHYKLGKLRICCFYLNEIIEIIDKHLSLNSPDSIIQSNAFDFIQIKIDASIELCKLYHIFEEFILMNELLENILKFIENVIDNIDLNSFNKKQLNSLRYFKIKCYSHLGICLAGLREFRLSKLSTRKCLCLIDNELSNISASDEQKSDLTILNSLKIECLMDATDASNQMLRTYRQMKNFVYDSNSTLKDKYDAYEIKTLVETKKNRINTAKNAYLLSKNIIDPNFKTQTAFILALCLYENHLYQSAAYYFNEVLSISTIHTDKNKNENLFYSDASPDYKLESTVYFCKCQLLIDYYGIDSLVKNNDFDLNEDNSKLDFEFLYRNLIKTLEQLIKYALKWRLHETNRASFQFNLSNLEYLKQDKDSVRLKNLIKVCSECLIYMCYKLNKIEESLIYMELESFINDSNLNDLIDLKLIDLQNEFNFQSLSYENLFNLIKLNQNFFLRYKFIFESKLLYIMIVDPTKEKHDSIIYHNKLKTSQILNKVSDTDELEMYDSKIHLLIEKFDVIQNDRVKNRIHEFEYRSVPGAHNSLGLLRIKNRKKERDYFMFLNQSSESNMFYIYNFESIDLFNLKLSDKLADALEKIELKSEPESMLKQSSNFFDEFKNLIDEIFFDFIINPVQEYFNHIRGCFNVLIDYDFAKIFVYMLNSFNMNRIEKVSFLIVFDTFLKYSSILVNSFEKDYDENLELMKERQDIVETPRRFKPIEQSFEKVPKSQIKPQLTSHPRLARNLINEAKDSEFVQLRNDHVQRAKNRLDASVSILITETISGTNAKRSNLEVIEFKQLNKKNKCCVIGCPDVPKKLSNTTLKIDRFLKNGLSQLTEISKQLYTEALFSKKMTKRELIYQLETNDLIFLSTFSSNESDSFLICSQSIEFPSSYYEFDKYCKLTIQDLDVINMHRCNLIVLNCYSNLNHKPRYDLVKKFLSRGCKSILMVLTPLEDYLMSLFYKQFFDSLKQHVRIDIAYSDSIQKFIELNPELDPFYINNSFCLISTNSLNISITELAKSMLQLNVDKTLAKYEAEFKLNSLNLPQNFSILSPNFVSSLEKNLIYLQIMVKFLLNDLITDSEEIEFIKNEKFEKIFVSLNEQITKSINNIKSNKMGPEPLNDHLDQSLSSQNLLKSLGFSIQRASVYTIRDEKDKKVILYPDQRYLDLNVRLTHVMNSLVDLCFKIDNPKVKLLIYNLEALLPIDDKNLLKCLIDIIAITAFSPDVILNSTDSSIYYALNYFEYLNDNRKSQKVAELMKKDYFEWDFQFENDVNKKIEILPSDLCTKYSISNKIVNFLLSLGFEFIGTWIRFHESILNSVFLDLALKFLSSFTSDRDMSLYKEMNIHVLGQRSAVTRGLIRTASNLDKNDLKKKKDDLFKLSHGVPWCSRIETVNEMEAKIEYSDKYRSLVEKISKQRQSALNHYMNYVLRQSLANKNIKENELDKKEKAKVEAASGKHLTRIKYKTGGNASKTRVLANEKCLLTYEQIDEIRQYSYMITRKNMEKIDVEFKEKAQKLMLPLIKK